MYGLLGLNVAQHLHVVLGICQGKGNADTVAKWGLIDIVWVQPVKQHLVKCQAVKVYILVYNHNFRVSVVLHLQALVDYLLLQRGINPHDLTVFIVK